MRVVTNNGRHGDRVEIVIRAEGFGEMIARALEISIGESPMVRLSRKPLPDNVVWFEPKR